MDWFKKNWKSLIPVVTVLASVVGGILGVKLTVKTDPNATTPEVIIIVPDGADPIPVEGGHVVAARGGLHPLLLARAKVAAARMVAKEKGVSFTSAWATVNKVPSAEIMAHVLETDLETFGALGDWQFLKKIVDWLSDPANQEKLMRIVEFIFKMAMLFLAVGDIDSFNGAMDLLHQLGTVLG